MTIRKFLRRAGAVLLVGVVALGLYLWQLQRSGNFHTVVAHEIYRSNQPTPDRLARYQATDHIKAVLNLRGAHPGRAWYEAEKAAAQKLGLQLIDFQMSDHAVLSPGKIAELERVMRDAPKPLLIHCKAGADRTGLASALYLADFKHQNRSSAGWQLSILYGHIGIPWLSRAWPMDETWKAAARQSQRQVATVATPTPTAF